MDKKKIETLAAEIRLETLKVIHSRGFGHVGGSMDLADLMAVLYGEVMHFDPKNPRDPDRDWLVLSKGHAGPVAYATFGLMGFYPMEDAYTLNQPHTRFPSHTDRKLTPGVDLTTGSLGQGLPPPQARPWAIRSTAAPTMSSAWWATARPTRARCGRPSTLPMPTSWTTLSTSSTTTATSWTARPPTFWTTATSPKSRGLRPVHPGDRRPRRGGHLSGHPERL